MKLSWTQIQLLFLKTIPFIVKLSLSFLIVISFYLIYKNFKNIKLRIKSFVFLKKKWSWTKITIITIIVFITFINWDSILAFLKCRATPSWFSAIGTVTAAFLALFPQIRKLRTSNLIFQAVTEYKEGIGYVIKINIYNFLDRSELIKGHSIKLESINFYCGFTEKNKKYKKFFSDKIISIDRELHHLELDKLSMNENKTEYETDFYLNPMIIRGEDQIVEVNRTLPIIYKIEQSTETLSNKNNCCTISYGIDKANITVVKVHVETIKNKDNYWFYAIIISFIDKVRIYKTNTIKNIDKKRFNEEIEKTINKISPDYFTNLWLK